MQCMIYGCTKPAEYPFACCSKSHGYALKNILHWLQDGNVHEATQYMPVDPAERNRALQHYRDFINRNEPHGTEESSSVLHEPHQ